MLRIATNLGKDLHMTRVLCIGECMIELRHLDAQTLRLGYAGDTFNAAVYLRRTLDALGADADVAYLSGVGDDDYSAAMRAAWREHGIHDAAITVPGRAPGLYTVRTDTTGERSFTYWRSDSAARHLFGTTDWIDRLDGDVVYLSGITLQLMTATSRAALLRHLQRARSAHRLVVLDTNYRAAGWQSPSQAGRAMNEIIEYCDIVLATLDDEIAMHGRQDAQQAGRRITDLGPAEAVIKTGADGARLHDGRCLRHFPAVPVRRVRDTTAAGDSFAGAYLAARLAGKTPAEAAEMANGVAAKVVATPGAIAPDNDADRTAPVDP